VILTLARRAEHPRPPLAPSRRPAHALVVVDGDSIEAALKLLKKQMAPTFRDLKRRQHYTPRGAHLRAKSRRARRAAMKAQRRQRAYEAWLDRKGLDERAPVHRRR
jgi:ribosomal protein S21